MGLIDFELGNEAAELADAACFQQASWQAALKSLGDGRSSMDASSRHAA